MFFFDSSNNINNNNINNNMIILIDSFNNVTISKHRNRNNAIKAMHKHIEAVKKYNGKNSYLTYEIKESEKKDK